MSDKVLEAAWSFIREVDKKIGLELAIELNDSKAVKLGIQHGISPKFFAGELNGSVQLVWSDREYVTGAVRYTGHEASEDNGFVLFRFRARPLFEKSPKQLNTLIACLHYVFCQCKVDSIEFTEPERVSEN